MGARISSQYDLRRESRFHAISLLIPGIESGDNKFKMWQFDTRNGAHLMTTLTRCFVFVSVAICLIMAEQWRLTVAIKNYCIIFTFLKDSPLFQRRFFICLLLFAHNLWRRVFMQISTIASTIKRKTFTKSASRRKNSQALIITIKISFIISPLPPCSASHNQAENFYFSEDIWWKFRECRSFESKVELPLREGNSLKRILKLMQFRFNSWTSAIQFIFLQRRNFLEKNRGNIRTWW